MSPFQGMELQPIIQLMLKLFEREMWLLLGSGWMTLLSGMQKCLCSITHTLQGKELQRGRTAETIRRLMRIPMACSFLNNIYWAHKSTGKKNHVIYIFLRVNLVKCKILNTRINNILSKMRDSRKIILKGKSQGNFHCVHPLDILLFIFF